MKYRSVLFQTPMDIYSTIEQHRTSIWHQTFSITSGELVHKSGLAVHATEHVEVVPLKENSLENKKDQNENTNDAKNNWIANAAKIIERATSREDEKTEKKENQMEIQALKMVQKVREEQDKKRAADCDVAFISNDYKYLFFLNDLLKRRRPDLKTNIDIESEAAQWESLDNAELVVALLTPNFVNSGKHVDEFHVALARHRKSEDGPVLYPILISELPRWPTYFHLVPCRVACFNTVWREAIQEMGKILLSMLKSKSI